MLQKITPSRLTPVKFAPVRSAPLKFVGGKSESVLIVIVVLAITY